MCTCDIFMQDILISILVIKREPPKSNFVLVLQNFVVIKLN